MLDGEDDAHLAPAGHNTGVLDLREPDGQHDIVGADLPRGEGRAVVVVNGAVRHVNARVAPAEVREDSVG